MKTRFETCKGSFLGFKVFTLSLLVPFWIRLFMSLNCENCHVPINRSKRLTIRTNQWTEEGGDYEKDLTVCFPCYRRKKIKDLWYQKITIPVLVILGLITITLSDSLSSLMKLEDFGGQNVSPSAFILAGVLQIVAAGVFLLIRIRIKQNLATLARFYT